MSDTQETTETVEAAQVDGEATEETPTEVEETEGEASLGDAGKRALFAMKQKEKASRARAKELETKLAELEKKLSDQGKSEEEQAAEEARRNAESEAFAKANARILRSEVKAAATGKLADPSDALAFLDLSAFEVDENGDVDAEEISEAIQTLISDKPHLAAQGGKATQFDSGRGKQIPSQLSKADLNGMTPEQIEAARKAGRLDSLLGK